MLDIIILREVVFVGSQMVVLHISITLSVKVGNGAARKVLNLEILKGQRNSAWKYVLRSPIMKSHL